ncbi:MAG: DUF1330 domain-containing protein [Candidatus Adiutricales bacterium]
MPGYVVANYDLKDSEGFQKYPPAVGPTLAQYGGKILAAETNPRNIEGSPRQVIVIIEFESADAAQRWYDSPENTAIKNLRISTTEGWLAIADGFSVPTG